MPKGNSAAGLDGLGANVKPPEARMQSHDGAHDDDDDDDDVRLCMPVDDIGLCLPVDDVRLCLPVDNPSAHSPHKLALSCSLSSSPL